MNNKNRKILAIILFIIILMTICLTVVGVFGHFKSWIYANHINDKIAHITFGAILTFLAGLILYPRKLNIKNLSIDLGPAIMFVLFTLDETSQIFLPGRDANILDLLASFTGLAIGVLFFHFWKKRKANNHNA